jgi:hypothetical protein
MEKFWAPSIKKQGKFITQIYNYADIIGQRLGMIGEIIGEKTGD